MPARDQQTKHVTYWRKLCLFPSKILKLMSEAPIYFSLINHLDANSFNITLYEMSHGTLNYKNDRTESLLYNPL